MNVSNTALDQSASRGTAATYRRTPPRGPNLRENGQHMSSRVIVPIAALWLASVSLGAQSARR